MKKILIISVLSMLTLMACSDDSSGDETPSSSSDFSPSSSSIAATPSSSSINPSTPSSSSSAGTTLSSSSSVDATTSSSSSDDGEDTSSSSSSDDGEVDPSSSSSGEEGQSSSSSGDEDAEEICAREMLVPESELTLCTERLATQAECEAMEGTFGPCGSKYTHCFNGSAASDLRCVELSDSNRGACTVFVTAEYCAMIENALGR